MLFTTNWLTEIFSNYKGLTESNIKINAISTDSRKKSEQTLFIPLIGDIFDGHHYLKAAIKNGAVATLWDEQKEIPDFLPHDFPIFFVKDTIVALQELAFKYRQKVNPIVVGITGSNGKTTTKDLVGTILQTSYTTHITKGNFNNHIGLPLTILSMPTNTEVLVLEMGMNHFGEISRLSKIAEPDYAIITNIGESHIEFLGSRFGITKAKLEIEDGLKQNGCLILDGDEELLQEQVQFANVLRCGLKRENDIKIKNVQLKENGTSFSINDVIYHIPLLGVHHAKNASYAITLGKQLGIEEAKIKESIKYIAMTSMRFERIEGINGVSIINDAYNASPTSMKASIEVLKQMDDFHKKILVLGDMFELGDDSEQWHRSIADVINQEIHAVFTIGDMASVITEEINKRTNDVICEHIHTPESLIKQLQPFLQKDTIVLFKASRGMKLETYIDKLIPRS